MAETKHATSEDEWTDVNETALFSGDWYWKGDDVGFDVAFRGMPFTSWSGGETFLASRAVLERIAADQKRFAAENPALDFDQIRFDGDDAFLGYDGGRDEMAVERHDDLYVVGFGWTWSRLGEDDKATEVVE